MASVTASVHLDDTDKPFVETLDSGAVVLWLTSKRRGPSLIGTAEELLEVRRAIGRFLFPDEFEAPETLQSEAA